MARTLGKKELSEEKSGEGNEVYLSLSSSPRLVRLCSKGACSLDGSDMSDL